MHLRNIIFLVCLVSFSFCIDNSHNCGNSEFASKKKIQYLKSQIDFLNLSAKNVVASIGSGNGWFEYACSVYHDSITFYLEDIDTTCMNKTELAANNIRYSKIKGENILNNFVRVVGTDTSTNLPAKTFDKIIIMSVFHHFSNKPKMLQDLKRIIKPEGEMIIFEPLVEKHKKYSCNYYYTSDSIVNEVCSKGFLLTDKKEVGEGLVLLKFKTLN